MAVNVSAYSRVQETVSGAPPGSKPGELRVHQFEGAAQPRRAVFRDVGVGGSNPPSARSRLAIYGQNAGVNRTGEVSPNALNYIRYTFTTIWQSARWIPNSDVPPRCSQTERPGQYAA